jgi:hypothetical protein
MNQSHFTCALKCGGNKQNNIYAFAEKALDNATSQYREENMMTGKIWKGNN